MAKCFIFLSIFGGLDRVETRVSEEGINSLKALPKSSKLLWCVKTLIINRQNSILRFLIYLLYKYISIIKIGAGTLCLPFWSRYTLSTFCGSSLRNRKLIAQMSLLNRWFRIRQIVSRDSANFSYYLEYTLSYFTLWAEMMNY